jgi:lysyl endopeptidase
VKKFLLLIWLVCCNLFCLMLKAQIQQPGNVLPVQYTGSKTIPVIDLAFFAETKASRANEAKTFSRHKNEEFAYTTEVQYNYLNSGIWDTLENGWKIWRLGIRSEGAHSLSLIFTSYKLEQGVRVFLFDPAQQYTLGAYTHANNKPYEVLAIEPIPGELVFIEMQVPPFVVNPGKLCIGVVGHDYSGSDREHRSKDGWYGLSGACNPDIICYNDSLLSVIKHSVVRIVYAGKERCTGVLLNNTRNDAKAYLLTAQHCLKTEWLANTAVYFFDYESPYCNGPDGRNHKSVSGGTLKATTDNKLDFSLVELSEDIPFYYHPYYAGWDATGLATRGVFCIHHPWGDVKKIAIDDDQPVTDNFGEGYDYNTHWHVAKWETGTTEPGSSGAPLFSVSGRVIGNETGGDAYCENSVDDYFQQISHAWEDYPDSTSQLRYWLDPFKSTLETLKGYDPYENFWLTGDTLTNIQNEKPLFLSGDGLSWGYFSGHNSDYVETFAERFVVKGLKYLIGFDMDIARAYANSDTSIIKVDVWEGMDYNVKPVIQETVPIIDFVSNTKFFLEFDSAVMVRDTFMIGFKLVYTLPCDTFAVFHSLRDAGDNNTAFIIKEGQWIPMDDPSAYNRSVSLSLYPVIYDSLPGIPGYIPPVITDNLMVYPNPARGGVWIAFKKVPSGTVQVKLFDITGHLIWIKTSEDLTNPLYFSVDVPLKGAYLMQIITPQYIENKKLLLLK